jgi:hypothetical protein
MLGRSDWFRLASRPTNGGIRTIEHPSLSISAKLNQREPPHEREEDVLIIIVVCS